MSLTAVDNFMNPIVAGRAEGCLETLVPIAVVLTGDQHKKTPDWGCFPDAVSSSVIQACGRPSHP